MELLPRSGSRLVLIAFEGWNDAGEAASDCAQEIIRQWGLTPTGMIGGEEFFDCQTLRPRIERTESGSEIRWPRTRIHSGTVPGTEIAAEVVLGPEPSFLWEAYAELALSRYSPGDVVICLGSLLADSVHSRPIPVSVTSEDPSLTRGADAAPGDYEGPVGMIGVLAHAFAGAGIGAVSLWAAVPGYAAHAPSPKAELALLDAVEELTGLVFDQTALVRESAEWERRAERLAEEDEELGAFIRRVESVVDAEELHEASGEAIADEVEEFLKRRED